MITIPLTQGQVTTIDDVDWDLVKDHKWCAIKKKNETYYATTAIPHPDKPGRYTQLQMHRLLMGAKKGQTVDHKDRNGLNNRRDNLRFCTHSQNGFNSKKQTCYGFNKPSSEYKGVSLKRGYAKKIKWLASIVVDGKQIRLGSFDNEKEAALEYNLAAVQHRGNWANLNEVTL